VALEEQIMRVADILRREIQSFKTVLDLLILEEKCLIECDTVGLAEILEKQEDVFSSIACLEKSRMDSLVKISEQTGEAPEEITISGLAGMVEGTLRKELLDIGHLLGRLHEDIQRRKKSNTLLINQSIMLVESDIRIILSALNRGEDSEPGYTPRAEADKTTKSICVDQKM